MQPDIQATLDEGAAMVRNGYSIGKAARAVGTNYDKLRNYLNPERRIKSRQRYRDRVAAGDKTRHYVKSHVIERDKMIPGDILAERDKAMNQPRSLTAMLCGDPAPCRAALARRAAE